MGRGVKASTRTIGKVVPGGDVEFQFRSDDLPPILNGALSESRYLLHLVRAASVARPGSSLFLKAVPTFGGSAFGVGSYTHPRATSLRLAVLKKYFDTTENSGINAQWYKSCIVDQLAGLSEADDDAKVTASFRAGTLDAGTAVGSLMNPNSTLGSYSTKSVFNFVVCYGYIRGRNSSA